MPQRTKNLNLQGFSSVLVLWPCKGMRGACQKTRVLSRAQGNYSTYPLFWARPLVKGLDKLCFPEDDPLNTACWVWVYLYTDSKGIIEPAGYCSLDYAGYSDRGLLARAGVLEKYRGYGLQRKMIKDREAYALNLGFSVVVTYTAPESIASANNLIKCGYKLYTPGEAWGVKGANYWWRITRRE